MMQKISFVVASDSRDIGDTAEIRQLGQKFFVSHADTKLGRETVVRCVFRITP